MRRALVVLSILLLVLAAGLVLLARSEWVQARLRAAVLEALSERLDAEIRLDRARIRLLPPSIELSGLSARARARPDLPPILEADRVRVSIDPLLLLARRIDLDRVLVVEPRVTLVFEGKALANLPRAIDRQAPEGAGGPGFEVVLRTVTIEGGGVRLEFPRQGPLTIDVALERVVLRPDLRARAADFGLTLSRAEITRRRFRQPVARVEAEGRLSAGGLEIRRFRGHVLGLVASARGSIAPFPDPELRLAGTVVGPLEAVARTYIDPYTSSDEPFPLSGVARATFTSAGPVGDARFEVALTAERVRLATVSADRVQMDVEVTYDWSAIRRATVALGPAAVGVTGRVDYDGPIPFEARLEAPAIPAGVLLGAVGAPAPPAPFDAALVSGEVGVRGAAREPRRGAGGGDDEAWRVGAGLRLQVSAPPAGGDGAAATVARTFLPVLVAGRVDLDEAAVRLASVTIRGVAPRKPGGPVLPDVALSGEVGLPAPHALALRGSASVEDLAALTPFLGEAGRRGPLAGAASLRGAVTGPLAAPAFAGDLEARGLRVGRFGPGDATGPIALSASRVASSGLLVRLGATRARASGALEFEGPPRLALDLTADPVQVEEVLAAADLDLPVRGRGRLTARLAGPLDALEGEAGAALAGVRAYGQPIDRVEAAVALGRQGAVRVTRVVLTRGGGRLTARAARSPEGALSGSLALENLPIGAIEAVSARGIQLVGRVTAQATLGGTWQAPTLTGRVGLVNVSYDGVPFGDSGVDVTLYWPDLAVRGTLVQRETGIVANLRLVEGRPFVVALDLNNPNLAPYLARFGAGRTVRASARGIARAAGSLDDLGAARAELRLGTLRVDVGDFYLQSVGETALVYERRRLEVASATFQGPTSQAVFGGHVDLASRSLDLRVNGGLDLSVARLFTDRLARARGTARIVAQAVGPFDAPRLIGAAELEGGSLAVRALDPPVAVEDLRGLVVFDADRVVLEGLDARIGGGRARVSGAIELAAFRPSVYNLSAVYDEVTLAIPRWLPSTSRGTLRLTGSPQDLLVSGSVDVARATYNRRIDVNLEALYRAIRAALEPRRAVRPDAAGAGPRVDIRISAPDDVRIQTGLFDAELRANLHLVGRLADPNLLGSAEVVTGTITFRDTVFAVTSGRADFIDPFRINPSFDLTAEARVREFDVVMRLSGTVDRYRIEFSSPSHPALTELDILSLITVGVTATEARDRVAGTAPGAGAGGEVSAAQAIAVLSGASRRLEREVQRLTGTETIFQIEPGVSRTTRDPEAKFTVGRRVGEDVTVLYSRGVGGEQDQSVQVEYRLSINLALVAQWSNTESVGGGVKFRFQFR